MSAAASTALVIGKFWPPHVGHHALIGFAQELAPRVVVVVCATNAQRPTGLERAIWLQQVHPACEVVVVDDFCAWHHPLPCADECSAKWARRVDELRLGAIDLVVTSELYGQRFADELGASHVSFDHGRSEHPVSATEARRSLAEHWTSLHPAVRAGLHRRVVILGAESTGTTTLAVDLAAELNLPLVAEVGRAYSWALYAPTNTMGDIEWTPHHFWQIVDRQIASESAAVFSSIATPPGPRGPWLVCDTDTLATVAWWERYLGLPSEAVGEFALSRLPDLYLLTSPEGVEFDGSDPLRDGFEVRLGMHRRLHDLVEASGRPFRVVDGTRKERLRTAVEMIDDYERSAPRFVHG